MLNEGRLFSSNCSETERAEAYKKLSQELLQFFQVHSTTPNHLHILKTTKQLFSNLLKREEIKDENQTSDHSTILRQAYLYQNSNSNLNSAKDFWEEADLAELQNQKAAWIKADESQKPAQETSNQFSQIKKAKLEEDLAKANPTSLFYQYWSRNLQSSKGFDGWKG